MGFLFLHRDPARVQAVQEKIVTRVLTGVLTRVLTWVLTQLQPDCYSFLPGIYFVENLVLSCTSHKVDFEFLWYPKTTGVSSVVAHPLSQTNYTETPSKIYHFNKQKLGSSSKTGYPGCTDNPTRHNRVKKDWSGAPFSVTFQSRPAGLPDKKISVHSPTDKCNLGFYFHVGYVGKPGNQFEVIL